MKTISRSFPEKSTSLDIKVSKIYLHLFIFNKYSGKILTVMRFLCFVFFSFKMEQSPTSLIISDFYNLVSNGHMSQKNGQIMQLWSSTEGLLWAGWCTDILLYSMSIYLAMFFKILVVSKYITLSFWLFLHKWDGEVRCWFCLFVSKFTKDLYWSWKSHIGQKTEKVFASKI